MALGGIVSKVLTEYKADTSDHRREIKKLQGVEKERHQKLLSDTEAQNKKLAAAIKSLRDGEAYRNENGIF